MSPNGRRAWRRTMRSRRKRKVAGLVFGPDTKARASLVSVTRGFLVAYWRRHKNSMHVEGGLRLCFLVSDRQSPIPLTARSLVGMTMGARKRAYRAAVAELEQAEVWRGDVVDRSRLRISERLRPCPGCCACWGHRISSAYGEIAECCGPQTSGKRKSQIKAMRKWQETLADNCDGSGVLPARRS